MVVTFSPECLVDLQKYPEGVCFSEFMRHCLYHPTYGYYTQAVTRQGAKGDYHTAPTLGPLFAETLAIHLSTFLSDNPDWSILEIGPGRGDLCHGLINALARVDCFPNYFCVEPFKKCWSMQQDNCRSHLSSAQFANISWLAAIPTEFKGIIIANEILDALPCSLVISDQQASLHALHVDCSGISPSWVQKSMHISQKNLFFARDLPLYPNYRYELHDYTPWLSNISKCLIQGQVYLFDYGYPRASYYHPERCMGTLSCFAQQTTHADPLLQPTQQDISIHVDFTTVAQTAYALSMDIALYTTFEQFLSVIGIHEAFSHLCLNPSIDTVQSLHLARHYLLHPDAMGEVMKVMLLTKGCAQLDRSFASIDLAHTL